MRFPRILLKIMLIFLMNILIGMEIGQSQVYAESKSVWIDPVGMVGTASTTGHPTATGGSASNF